MIHYFQIAHVHVFSRQTVVSPKRPCSAFTRNCSLRTNSLLRCPLLAGNSLVLSWSEDSFGFIRSTGCHCFTSVCSGHNALVFVLFQAITKNKSINFLVLLAWNIMLLFPFRHELWFYKPSILDVNYVTKSTHLLFNWKTCHMLRVILCNPKSFWCPSNVRKLMGEVGL